MARFSCILIFFGFFIFATAYETNLMRSLIRHKRSGVCCVPLCICTGICSCNSRTIQSQIVQPQQQQLQLQPQYQPLPQQQQQQYQIYDSSKQLQPQYLPSPILTSTLATQTQQPSRNVIRVCVSLCMPTCDPQCVQRTTFPQYIDTTMVYTSPTTVFTPATTTQVVYTQTVAPQPAQLALLCLPVCMPACTLSCIQQNSQISQSQVILPGANQIQTQTVATVERQPQQAIQVIQQQQQPIQAIQPHQQVVQLAQQQPVQAVKQDQIQKSDGKIVCVSACMPSCSSSCMQMNELVQNSQQNQQFATNFQQAPSTPTTVMQQQQPQVAYKPVQVVQQPQQYVTGVQNPTAPIQTVLQQQQSQQFTQAIQQNAQQSPRIGESMPCLAGTNGPKCTCPITFSICTTANNNSICCRRL